MARHGLSIFGLLGLIAASSASAGVTISTHVTQNMSCSAGVCTPTAADAFLNVTDLKNMLKHADLTVQSNATAPNIDVASVTAWTNAHTLTLNAYGGIAISSHIMVQGTGSLAIVTNAGGLGGDYAFFSGARIVFRDAASGLTINGQSYVLVDSVSALAAAVSANGNANIALMSDFDASTEGTYSDSPVTAAFGGTFTGLGNAINRLTIVSPGGSGAVCLGLFKQNGGTIRSLNLQHASLTLTAAGFTGAAGGLLTCTNDGTISNVVVSGTVGGTFSQAGGIAGINAFGKIEQSNASVTVSGQFPGGLAGYNNAAILRSAASGHVTVIGGGKNLAGGGLAALNSGGSITLSHASVDLSNAAGEGHHASVGGLVGFNFEASISQSYATGAVASAEVSRAGGLVGYNRHGTISQSYALGSASGANRAVSGGLVGLNEAAPPSISQSYSTGAVSVSGTGLAGGLVGNDNSRAANITNSYWDLDTSGISDPSRGAGSPANDPGITGLSDSALKSGLPSGFDPAVWGSNVSINNGLPYLLAQPPG
jgi:hypothetical protein